MYNVWVQATMACTDKCTCCAVLCPISTSKTEAGGPLILHIAVFPIHSPVIGPPGSYWKAGQGAAAAAADRLDVASRGAAARSETWRPWHFGPRCCDCGCAVGPTAGAQLARSQPPCPCCGLLHPSVSGQLGSRSARERRGQAQMQTGLMAGELQAKVDACILAAG